MNKTETRGRKTLDPKEKKQAVIFYIPLKNHAKFKKEADTIVKKYL